MQGSWRNFVFQTYNEIKTGTKIPDYFGCLKNLIESAQKNDTLPGMSPPFSMNHDDFNDDNYMKSPKRISNNERQRFNKNVSRIQDSPDHLETPLTKSSKQLPDDQSPETPQTVQSPQTPPSDSPYQLESFQSQTPRSSGSQSLSPETQASSQISSQVSPHFQRQYSKRSKFSHNLESDVEETETTETEQPHEEEQNEEEQHETEQNEEEQYSEPHFDQSYSLSSPPPKNPNNYASKFREIGDSIIGTYWFPIETTIPRLTLDSKLMSSFKVSKFKNLMNAMNEHFSVLEPHHLKYVRYNKSSPYDEMNDFE